jgi:hypothetical protein
VLANVLLQYWPNHKSGHHVHRYVLTAPVLDSGWVLLGETGKFFIATTDRFSGLSASAGEFAQEQLGVDVHGASNEGVIVELIPPGALAAAEEGSGQSVGAIVTIKVRCQLSPLGAARLSCRADHACTCS